MNNEIGININKELKLEEYVHANAKEASKYLAYKGDVMGAMVGLRG
jgi:hypothetical protein